jgi:hypothetical protein
LPNLKEHLKLSKELLGTRTPLVHQLLDARGKTLEHRYRHGPKTVKAIEELLGSGARLEAWLHILVDWGMIRR